LYAFPHLLFEETLFAEAGEAVADDARVEVASVELKATRLERVLVGNPALEHVPNFESHPMPQYALDFPQYPYWLQHEPCREPEHVNPVFPPQVPSVVTLLSG
jgi:hypothetical protein